MKPNEYCCISFEAETGEESDSQAIIYLPPIRTFMIQNQKGELIDIQYCPWCGSKLPDDLIEELTRIIYEQL